MSFRDSLITLNPRLIFKIESLSFFSWQQQEAIKFKMHCPVLKPRPFQARLMDSSFVCTNSELTKLIASLSPMRLFQRLSSLMFITSPDWLITFIKTTIVLGASPKDASERRRIPMKGNTVSSLTIDSFLTPVFSRLYKLRNIITLSFI